MEKLFTGSEAMFQIRTDLALETREKFDEDHIEVKGVRVDEERISPEIMITRVFIDTENGAGGISRSDPYLCGQTSPVRGDPQTQRGRGKSSADRPCLER